MLNNGFLRNSVREIVSRLTTLSSHCKGHKTSVAFTSLPVMIVFKGQFLSLLSHANLWLGHVVLQLSTVTESLVT